METNYKTDWIASQPIFYNEKNLRISHNINDVINWADLELHPEGLFNYLRFGYSVFGQTPVKHVKFLLPHSEISVKDNQIHIKRREDTAITGLHQHLYSESDIVDLMKEQICGWAKAAKTIIVPTSGGYDSRLLNALVDEKSKLRAFSYGASPKHPEAMKAALLCKKLNISWEYIELGKFHNYLGEWDELFGISTHAHGMYQMEFYHKINRKGYGGAAVLSGIIGDLWAGSINVPPIRSADDVCLLGYTHNATGDCTQSLLPHDNELLQTYFEEKREYLQDPVVRVLETVRLKIILLSYLLRVPQSLGFQPWSPFLNQELALAMLNLPPDRRHHRLWQKELFQKMDIDMENLHINGSRKGHIVLNGIRQVPLKPLNTAILKEAINPDYVDWINRTLTNQSYISYIYDDLMFTPYIKEVMKKAGLKHKRIDAYSAYLTLKPIENLLLKRNEARAKA